MRLSYWAICAFNRFSSLVRFSISRRLASSAAFELGHGRVLVGSGTCDLAGGGLPGRGSLFGWRRRSPQAFDGCFGSRDLPLVSLHVRVLGGVTLAQQCQIA